VKIEITLDVSRIRWMAPLAIVAVSTSCVPRESVHLIEPAFAANAVAPAPANLDATAQEQVSRKVAQLLVPVSSSPAAAFIDNSRSEEDHERSLDCLTAAIYYEARSESEDGQRAVAQVVLNRVRHPAYPSSVCGVVFQGSHRTTGCQFSFTCDGSMRGRRQADSWIRARRLAAEALSGSVFAPVGNATHYHTTAILPYWAKHLRRSAIIGAHIFYRWAGNAGEASAFRQNYGGLEPTPMLWQARGGGNDSGVTVHRGSHVGDGDDEAVASKWREEIALDDGATVTVHRGARSGPKRISVQAQLQEEGQAQEAAQDPAALGVRIHRGTEPEAG
jgi:spore germination cell wall hydrolase CwlJ-like protein